MNQPEFSIFVVLFREVCAKCFGQPLIRPLSEPESRHLSNEIEDRTGLVVGWKSIKNYAAFILIAKPGKQPNPSVATLDTLARYLCDAPATSEIQRQKSESSYPYWFEFRGRFTPEKNGPLPARKRPMKQIVIWGGLGIVALLAFLVWLFQNTDYIEIAENFQALDEPSLRARGWNLLSEEPAHWNRRDEQPGQLSLFTLKGDNWQTKEEIPLIRNLLVRKIHDDCFNAEVHFSNFVPHENWQQAGLLLLEDTAYIGKSIRLSIAYNDFFGGYAKPGEIIIQAIASYGKSYQNVEEIIHYPLFVLDKDTSRHIVSNNLKNSAVRIEKQGNTFRFLYAASPVEHFSFKELAAYEFGMEPKYVGIFALKGFVDTASTIPVAVRFFRLDDQPCQ